MQVDARALALQVVRAASLPALADTLVSAIALSRSVVLSRLWLLDSLELAASAGTPSGGGSYNRLDGEFRQFAVSDATIRDIASSREAFIVRGVRGDEDWLINASWAARQGVRAFLAFPLRAADAVGGVLAILDRQMPDDRVIADLQFVTDIAAARVAALHARTDAPPSPRAEGRSSSRGTEVVTRAELRRIEKENIEAALARTGGKVFGAGGAAALLGMKPTTLASRIKALEIR